MPSPLSLPPHPGRPDRAQRSSGTIPLPELRRFAPCFGLQEIRTAVLGSGDGSGDWGGWGQRAIYLRCFLVDRPKCLSANEQSPSRPDRAQRSSGTIPISSPQSLSHPIPCSPCPLFPLPFPTDSCYPRPDPGFSNGTAVKPLHFIPRNAVCKPAECSFPLGRLLGNGGF